MRAAVDDARRPPEQRQGPRPSRTRNQIVAERLADQAQRRVVKAICGKLRRVGRATRRDLRVACTARSAANSIAVFEMLLDKEIIAECEPDGKRSTPEYEFGPEYAPGVS